MCRFALRSHPAEVGGGLAALMPAASGRPNRWPALFAVLTLAGLIAAGVVSAWRVQRISGWGIDACLSCHVPASSVAGYLQLLHTSEIHWLRERGIGALIPDSGGDTAQRRIWRQERRAGYRVVAFASTLKEVPVEQEGDQLPENLLAVYRAFVETAKDTAGEVDAWEMVGEPETMYCRDLPDHVAAIQKAVYLGLKAGVREASMHEAEERKSGARLPIALPPPPAPGVLMGALAYAPGPWLERAAENGIYDYTDGLNMHFYGQASDLAGVIHAQKAMAKRYIGDRELPVWITECGVDSVPSDNLNEARGREIQRQFTIATAKTAAEEGVAVFFPFIFVWPGSTYAMVQADGSAFPAWNAYAEYTYGHPLAARPALAPPPQVARVVPQWAPNYSTCVPQKVSGTYWFKDRKKVIDPIRGALVFYNFSDAPVQGRVTVVVPDGFEISAEDGGLLTGRELEIPAMSSARFAVRCSVTGTGYRRGYVAVRFVLERSPEAEPGASTLAFGLETRPKLRRLPLRFSIDAYRPSKGGFQWIWAPEPYSVTSERGVWTGLNGVRVLGDAHSIGEFTKFSIPGRLSDPRLPPMAVTRVNGLKAVPNGFLHLRTGPESDFHVRIRVDLIDKNGQRFSIYENFGKNLFLYQLNDTYLGFDDFQLYVFGRCLEKPVFRPEDIREIQLRFFTQAPSKSVVVRLDVVAPGTNGAR